MSAEQEPENNKGKLATIIAAVVGAAAILAAFLTNVKEIVEFFEPMFGHHDVAKTLPSAQPAASPQPPPPPHPAPERDAIQHLMDFICNRGVLQNDYSWEVPKAVYDSVGEIRNQLGNTLGQLATDSAARQPLQNMQRASRILLQDPTIFPDGPDGLPRPISGPLRDAIHKFRAVFSQNTSQILQIYALKGNCDLSAGLEVVPSSSGVAEPKN